ncbi:MAG: sulfatase-like hydrolase/transferase [Victivallaceae bacterium]
MTEKIKKPNIIIFNPDQWRSDVMGCHGNPAAVTPFIDSLVKNDAVSFSNAFCQNPVCTPSRCSFMTGWYPHVRGHRTMHHMLHPEHGEPNLLEILKNNGYFVWWGGKNDLVPGQDGFEQYCDVKFTPDQEALKKRGLTLRRNLHSTVNEWAEKLEDGNAFSFYAGLLDKEHEDIYCDEDWGMVLGAMDFIENYDGEKPYCIYLPLQNPHPPYGIEEPYFSMIDRDKIPLRIPADEDCSKPMILNGIREGQNLYNWTESRWTELRAVYYGMCARLDEQFKTLVNALKQADEYESSAIFLFSDHGDFTGDYGLVEKTQNTFEDCLTRVPFIFKPPAGKAIIPGVNESLIELVDFPATVYNLTGIEPGYDHFGKSLLPLVSGEISELRRAVFCEGGRLMHEKQAMEKVVASSSNLYWPRLVLQASNEKPWHGKAVMCRTAKYKYVARHYELDEFYDLTCDPGEQVNQIDNQVYSDAIEAHKQLMLGWFIESCDVVPYKMDLR